MVSVDVVLKNGRRLGVSISDEIVLSPNDKFLENQLREKLTEYKCRWGGSYFFNLATRCVTTDSFLKVIILEELLQRRQLKLGETIKSIEDRFPNIDEVSLYSAWGVLASYCGEDRGTKLLGGTGLPLVSMVRTLS